MKRYHLSQGSLLLIIIMILTAGVWALLPVGNAAASCLYSVTVTSAGDSGTGTLRSAIDNVCADGTIDFNLTYPATINLAKELDINSSLTIKGPGADKLTISGGGTVGVFYIASPSLNVNISGLTISDGSGPFGGGIATFGTLQVADCTFSGNSAGGVYNDGDLTVTNCTFSGNSTSNAGGGIYNDGTVTVTNSTFSSNSAVGIAGGIYNDGTLTVTNSTFSGNSAPGLGVGGGIVNEGTLTVTNSTFSSNSASDGGGIYEASDPAFSASLRNTIVANNTGGNCHGTITSLGHNLESGTDCGFTQTGDQQNADPKLGPLALNPPGATETFALLAGSPAIDAADPNNFPPTDQRGVIRPQEAGPDIGAYEYAPPTAVPAMDGWGIIIFIILAGLGSVYYLRRRKRAEG